LTNGAKPRVLITGASRGLGKALAAEFAKAGHDLVLVARSGDALDDLAATLAGAHGIDVVPLAADLSTEDAVAGIADACQARGLHVGVLINNAGVMPVGALADASPSGIAAAIDLNVRAPTELAQRFLPQMIERRSGSIINISSIAGVQPLDQCVVYSSTKAYLTAFSEALHAELDGSGVVSQTVVLGPLKTDMLRGGERRAAKLSVLRFFASEPEVAAAVIYDGYLARRRRFSAGWLGAALHFGVRVLPRRVTGAIAARLT
jgi:short-subunit dehydrogenase